MTTVHCRVCGVFEDDDARTPVCPRCGLPATAQDFRMGVNIEWNQGLLTDCKTMRLL